MFGKDSVGGTKGTSGQGDVVNRDTSKQISMQFPRVQVDGVQDQRHVMPQIRGLYSVLRISDMCSYGLSYSYVAVPWFWDQQGYLES